MPLEETDPKICHECKTRFGTIPLKIAVETLDKNRMLKSVTYLCSECAQERMLRLLEKTEPPSGSTSKAVPPS